MLFGVVFSFALSGLNVCLSSVVWHWYADDHVEGKELVVEGTLSLHIDLRIKKPGVTS